jgi:phage shock protein E
MTWTTLPVLAVILIVFWLARHATQIPERDALVLLQAGALVIDVRTAGEFVAGHLPVAVNLPLNEIERSVTRRVESKDQVLLLHCQSGTRSQQAVKKLRAMGYEKAYNLGSYARAENIVAHKGASLRHG